MILKITTISLQKYLYEQHSWKETLFLTVKLDAHTGPLAGSAQGHLSGWYRAHSRGATPV